MKANTTNDNPTQALIIKNQVAKLNKKAVRTAEGFVDNTLDMAQQWQNLFAKAMKGSVSIAGQQQDLALSTLEAIKDQVLKNIKRATKLTSLKSSKKPLSVDKLEK